MKTLTQSPREPDFVQDPYGFYARARASGTLFYWEDYDLICAAGYNTVNTVLRDRRFGREAPASVRAPIPERLAPFYAIEANSMLERDPPTHTKLRGAVMRAFTKGRVEALAPEIEATAHALIDAFPAGRFDLLTAYAEPLPVAVISSMLGVPTDMARQLLNWSHAMVAMYQARRNAAVEAEAVRAALEFADYVRKLLVVRRKAPGDDLVSALVGAGDLNDDEITSTVILLLNAGHEATVHTIGNGVATLLDLPPDIRAAFADPARTEQLVAEVLRFDPPLHMFQRYAKEDLDLFGHTFKCGDQIGLVLASANRDGDAYARPDNFWAERPAHPHLSLGAGIHFCVGAPLAKLELGIALKALFEHCPDLRLAEPPVYADRYHFHGFDRLMVTT